MANCLEKCSGMFHGLTTKNVRTLADGMDRSAKLHGQINILKGVSGSLVSCARHETLVIRQLDATSGFLARATSLNKAGWCVLKHSP